MEHPVTLHKNVECFWIDMYLFTYLWMGWMNGKMKRYRWMAGCTDGWCMDGWINEWIDGLKVDVLVVVDVCYFLYNFILCLDKV